MANDRLDELEKRSYAVLRKAISNSKKPLVAFSGGKDAMVVAHMALRLGVKDFVCETSFVFDPVVKNIKKIAKQEGFPVVYKNSLDMNWLRKNKNVIFSTDSSVRSRSFAVRQQRTVKRHAKEIGADLSIFGRRTEENSVKSELYVTKSGLQCHPIRDWKESDVWAYFKKYNIEIPFVYSTEFGRLEGNAPFYALDPRQVGGVDNAWNIVSSIDPRFHKGMFDE